MSQQSFSSETASKASTRMKGKHSSEEAPQEDEKRALSETPEEKKMRRQEKKEMDKTRKLFESTALSSADELETGRSAVSSALKSVDDADDTDDEKKSAATPKVKRAPFVVTEAKENIDAGSRLSKEVAYGSPSTTARKWTNSDSFQRTFDRDERPSTGKRL
jgi:hypothetical protein